MARWLAGVGMTPNMVSVASMLFAGGAWYAYELFRWEQANPVVLLIVAATCIQLRLLCNLLDGLLAIEGGLKTKSGDLYNEVPDRLADIVILIGAGHAAQYMISFANTLGWTCAIFAVLTAYVRLLGGSLGFRQEFIGPMAKQHRMFTLTVGTLASAVEGTLTGFAWGIVIALGIILVGSAFTFVRRLSRIARQLEAR